MRPAETDPSTSRFVDATTNPLKARRRALLVGPLIERRRRWLRYGSAIALLLIVALGRFALIPVLGSQAPLLPFVAAVLAIAYLGGRGPALMAALLAALESERTANTSETRLRLVADSLPLLVAYVDRDLRYRFSPRTQSIWLRSDQTSNSASFR